MFGLAIGLRMIRSGLPVIDVEQGGHLYNGVVDEMSSSITDENLGTAKMRNDVLIKKNSRLLSVGGLNCLGFSPLGQILRSHNNVFVSSR
jgi:hypothetical protein